jgi:hypothetical protein
LLLIEGRNIPLQDLIVHVSAPRATQRPLQANGIMGLTYDDYQVADDLVRVHGQNARRALNEEIRGLKGLACQTSHWPLRIAVHSNYPNEMFPDEDDQIADCHDSIFKRTLDCEEGTRIRYYKLNDTFNPELRFLEGQEAGGVEIYSVPIADQHIDEENFHQVLQERLAFSTESYYPV